MNEVFINKALTYAISEYLEHKNNPNGIDYNSFFVVVIRLLTLIYDELDILNPYYFNSVEMFHENLRKYGYNQDNILSLELALQNYYDDANANDFTFIQKCLIDMFVQKKLSMNVSDNDIKKFSDILYTPDASNPLIVSYNFMMASNPTEVKDYFDKEIKKQPKEKNAKPKETLNLEAYEILKYSLDDIKMMSSSELDKVNKEVYSYFNINENAINKNYLLDKAVYDFNHPKTSFSTGNGYVDILFFLGIVSTLGMIILLITIIL